MATVTEMQTAYVAALQKIVDDATAKSAPLRAQIQALQKQIQDLEGADAPAARQALSVMHRRRP